VSDTTVPVEQLQDYHEAAAGVNRKEIKKN